MNNEDFETFETEDIKQNDDMQKNDEPVKKTPIRKIICEICLYIVLFVVCIYVVPNYVLQRTVVSGSSMLDTLHDGESMLVEKVSYRFKDPSRFDIIVFYPYGRDDKEDYYVKRVIGLPGETIQIKGKDIYINGEILEENYGKDPISDEGIAIEPITLADDEFFVLGDNREISEDSRIFGPVKKSDIEGHAVIRIYPFDKFGLLTDK